MRKYFKDIYLKYYSKFYHKRFIYLILSSTLFLVILYTQKFQKKSAPQIAKIAKSFTVKLESSSQGSGIIIKKVRNKYTILTSWHVVKDNSKGEEIGVITNDNKEHIWIPTSLKKIGEVDLAIFEFESKDNYKTAKLGNVNKINEGDNIFVAGFPGEFYQSKPRNFRFKKGSVVTFSKIYTKDGYQLQYTNPTVKGMSGGSVLDNWGNLIGVHGRADKDFPLTYDLGKLIASGINKAIPIDYYKTFINGN